MTFFYDRNSLFEGFLSQKLLIWYRSLEYSITCSYAETALEMLIYIYGLLASIPTAQPGGEEFMEDFPEREAVHTFLWKHLCYSCIILIK